jgi:RHS repeat-associated protein
LEEALCPGLRAWAFRSSDGTTYFDHQHWTGTERVRTNYAGSTAALYASFAYGDDSYPFEILNPSSGYNQDNAFYAGLDYDSGSSTDHAMFRQYTPQQGRWMSPDPYSGSYDAGNPQSFNRYSYVMNNPVALTDPSGLDGGSASGIACISAVVQGGANVGSDAACAVSAVISWLFFDSLFRGSNFHGTLKPRPSTPNSGWDGNFGESLGIPTSIPQGNFGLGMALGLPSQGCEFGACGGGPMDVTPGAAVYSAVPYINMQSWQQLLAHVYPWYWFQKGGSNIVPGTHSCGPGGWGSTNGPVDAACYQHDLCYGNLGIGAARAVTGLVPASAQAGKAACDQQLCQATSNNAYYTPDQMAQQFWVSAYFNCH